MSTSTLNTSAEREKSLHFDWYQSTVRDDFFAISPHLLPDVLGEDLGAASRSDEQGIHGYQVQSVLRSSEGSVVARVLYGGKNMWPNAWASGDRSTAFADVMRARFPASHAVTRADVAYDVQSPDSFDQLQAVCLGIADDRGLKISQAGDWHRGVDGRTLYVGSRKSPQFTVLYEKGKEQRAKAPTPEAAAAVPIDWSRLELRVMPQKLPRRLLAAVATPAELYGFSLWTKQLATEVLALDVPRVERLSWLRPEDEVTFDWLVEQYASLLERQEQSLGSWENVWAKFERKIKLKQQRR